MGGGGGGRQLVKEASVRRSRSGSRARPNLGGAPSLRVEGGLAHEAEVDDAAWRCRIRRHRGQIRFPCGGGSGASALGSDRCKPLEQRRWEAEAAGGSR
uniref:Uncharacterized protein n=1 Tax=Oryza rufipogon TaxID=4529 RepID=A0A0E0Q5U4_ORYRU